MIWQKISHLHMHVEKSLLELSWQQVKKKKFYFNCLKTVCILGNFFFQSPSIKIRFYSLKWLKIIRGKLDLKTLLFPQSSCLLPDGDIWDNSRSAEYTCLLKLTMQLLESNSKINFIPLVTQVVFLGFGSLCKKLHLLSMVLRFCPLFFLAMIYSQCFVSSSF